MQQRSIGDRNAKIRACIAQWVAEESLYAVARKLSTSREGLSSYLVGEPRAGTTLLIETIFQKLYAKRLEAEPTEPAAEATEPEPTEQAFPAPVRKLPSRAEALAAKRKRGA